MRGGRIGRESGERNRSVFLRRCFREFCAPLGTESQPRLLFIPVLIPGAGRGMSERDERHAIRHMRSANRATDVPDVLHHFTGCNARTSASCLELRLGSSVVRRLASRDVHHRSVPNPTGDLARGRYGAHMRSAAPHARHEDVVLAISETGSDNAVLEGRAQAESVGSSFVICHVTDSDQPSAVAATTSEIVIRHGKLATVAAEEATKRNVRMIVVDASDAHHMGATAAELVVRHASCSVLVTRPAYGLRVVVATDLSPPSLPAIAAGIREARRRNVAITVVHCVEDRAAIEEATSAIARILVEHACEAEIAVLQGPPLESILRSLDGVGADLLVLADHGHRGLVATLLGSSTTEALVRAAPCSVLVVRS